MAGWERWQLASNDGDSIHLARGVGHGEVHARQVEAVPMKKRDEVDHGLLW